MTANRRTQGGLGLLEVLIALVVVSLGVLGMAGLQLTGMKHSAGGFNRSKALMFAENMATRMRINAPGVAANAYGGDDGGFDSADAPFGSCALPPARHCQAAVTADGTPVEAARCDTGQLAEFDLRAVVCGDWGGAKDGEAVGEGVVSALPDGRLTIDCDGAPCETYTITVQWNEGSLTSEEDDAVDVRRVQLRLRP